MIVNITLTTGIIQPEQLPELLSTMPEAGGIEGVIISGRLPVWAYAAIAHYFHPRPWIATFEPRLGQGVVVVSHIEDVRIGQLIPIDGQDTVEVIF